MFSNLSFKVLAPMKSFSIPCVLLAALFSVSCNAAPLNQRPEVNDFIEQMVKKHGFTHEDLSALFARVKIKTRIIKAMKRPAESKPWHVYRKIFITDRHINGGVNFWRGNESILSKLSQQYGVPAEILVAIIGVETRYGNNTGSHRVIDALSTLAFDYPKRSKFFLSELEQFLILCREENMDPMTPIGSYAGAMGLPQFMPSSFRHYAADFDGDGRRDIWQNKADVMASVANYFTSHGWKQGGAITFPIRIDGNHPSKLLTKGLKPDSTVGKMEAQGLNLPKNLNPNTETKLLKLDNEYGPSYWVTLHNFYVITRYNHSSLYAMAVYQLSQEILSRRNADHVF